ncbi:MAG TPA: PQQ-dependent sugar dehydrogenase [bacterium]|jgi:glucose/arabinose dehydrogenase
MQRPYLGQLLTCAYLVICLLKITPAQASHTIRVASGLSRPVLVTAPLGDTARIFIVEQRSGSTGAIRIERNSSVLSRPFLSVPNLATGSEQGLLGLAFHPNYATNGYFFVNYTRSSDGATVIARFHVSSDPDSADAASGQTILTIPQPFANHNGGNLAFGNDGYLYIGMGDGGDANDPGNRAQSDTTLLGKLLRIDVDSAFPYAIPPTNPWAVRHEIWAKGLRNPWRWSFDRATHDLYIGDVGQGAWEEIDVQAAGSPGGENYGWRCMEGLHCTGLSGCTCNDPALTLPIYNYDHSGGKCAITGGYVYRGCADSALQGTYFFADFCSNQIWSFRYVNGTVTDFQERTAELAPSGGLSITSISSFGQDALGELYICDLDGGEVFKILPDNPVDCNHNGRADACDIAAGFSRDANHNGIPDECECVAATVQDLTAQPSGNDLLLNWTVGGGLETYTVYRATSVDAPFPGPGWAQIAAGLTAASFADSGAIAASDRYFYLVTAVCP